jgi:peptidoglycan/xylan/chitin deacetylase (PgdA/CDA1 family)
MKEGISMREAYLTIDDSPSVHTVALTDFLVSRGVPAIYFCRGDMMEQNGLGALVDAVRKGIVLGNHAYHHYRASEHAFDVYVGEIRETEKLIDQVYTEAGVKRGRKYFRFPHIDRGAGGWIIDYNQLSEADRADVIAVFSDGLNINLTPPTPEMLEKKAKLQAFLKAEGFSPLLSEGITFPWYQGELAHSIDMPYTYSISDWMLLNRHKGKWPYKSLDDLKVKIDQDRWFNQTNSRHIILAHDKDEIEIVIRDLVDHCLEQGVKFIPLP